MNIQLINTGTELMLGRVLNTHQQWICRQLADHGYTVDRQVAIDDSGPAIVQAVRDGLAAGDLVITTGGLGPTSDDRTRDLIAEMLGLPLHEDAAALANIERFFTQRKRAMPVSTRVQAMVPQGATVLQNANGTAPGLALAVPAKDAIQPARLLIMLPGPPRELRPMFSRQALPLIQERFPIEGGFVCRTLKTTGLGESLVEERIAGPLRALTDGGMELGYCARTGEVDVRFVARGPRAAETVSAAEQIVRAQIGAHIFGLDDEQLEGVLIQLLTARKQTIALAESCTGGYVSNRLTNVPGASAVLLAGLVTYANAAKVSFLDVPDETLVTHGAVSEETARAMAEGARRRVGADYALSVTGIAGPSGGTEAKPVGTVFVGLASPRGVHVRKFMNPFDRETFKYVTSQQALEMLRRELLASGG